MDIACPPFTDPAVAARYAAYGDTLTGTMVALRQHILHLADQHFGPNRVMESLKWNQPSFNIIKPKRGTTLRMDADGAGSLSLYFTCTSGLVDRFRNLYDDELTLVGNRELRLGEQFQPNAAIDHCILLALDPYTKG